MKKKTKKVRLPQPYAAARNYLEKNGWNVVVIGGTSVEQGSAKYNFFLRIGFTGSKKTE